jgi:hypothetical protein
MSGKRFVHGKVRRKPFSSGLVVGASVAGCHRTGKKLAVNSIRMVGIKKGTEKHDNERTTEIQFRQAVICETT